MTRLRARKVDRKQTQIQMERIIVTGANGMLASNIIGELLKDGYEVIGTVRSLSRYHGPQGEGLELAECDFKDTAAMEELMDGCSGLIHVAAMTSQGENDYSKFRKVNVTATEELVKAAIRKGLKRFLYVSTANAIGFGEAEGKPMTYPFTESHYAVSKAEAEKVILPYKDKIDIVIVNPTFMAGRYGTAKGSNRLFNMVRKSPVVFCPKGGKNVLDVQEAARGMVLAYQKGRNGENYLITGRNYSYRELFSDAAKAIGRHPLLITVPNFLLKAAGALGDLLHKMGVSTELSKSNVTMLMINNHYHTDKAEKELGFKAAPINFREMLSYDTED